MRLTESQKKEIFGFIEDCWEYDCDYAWEITYDKNLKVEIAGDYLGVDLLFLDADGNEVEIEDKDKLIHEIDCLCNRLVCDYQDRMDEITRTEDMLGRWLVSEGNYMGA